MSPQLLIFDCDGVLVDSEKISTRVISEELTRFGLAMSPAESLQEFAGGALSNVRDYFLAKTQQVLPDDFEAIYRQRTKQAFASELEAVEGVEKVLKKFQQVKCVGSNGPLHKIKSNLQKTGLSAYFEQRLYSAYDIGFWKPLPHLYQHAAQVNGVAPQDCVVIEDSVAGVKAAVAAGIPVFAYTATNDAQKLAQAGATTFDHMHELLDLIH